MTDFAFDIFRALKAPCYTGGSKMVGHKIISTKMRNKELDLGPC
jgi:hypothetical protein